MEIRSIQDIYPSWHPRRRDADEVARLCANRFSPDQDISSTDDFTNWIERCYHDPYDREALAAGMTVYLSLPRDPSDDDFINLRTYEREQVDAALLRITRHARADQVALEADYCDPQTNPAICCELPDDILQRVNRLEDSLRRQQRDHEALKASVAALIAERAASLPPDSDYKALLRWLDDEKAAGRDHLRDAEGNRSELARRLSERLGWVVDVHSLNRAINRRR